MHNTQNTQYTKYFTISLKRIFKCNITTLINNIYVYMVIKIRYLNMRKLRTPTGSVFTMIKYAYNTIKGAIKLCNSSKFLKSGILDKNAFASENTS